MRFSKILKATLALVLILFLVFAWYRWNLSALFEPARIEALMEQIGPFAPLIYMAVMAATAVIIPIPGPPLFVIAGALFGPVMGTIYAVIGSVAGALIAFLIARFLGRDFVESLVGKQVVICCECSEGLLAKIVFFSRLLPLISFDVVSYGAGLTRMSLRKLRAGHAARVDSHDLHLPQLRLRPCGQLDDGPHSGACDRRDPVRPAVSGRSLGYQEIPAPARRPQRRGPLRPDR